MHCPCWCDPPEGRPLPCESVRLWSKWSECVSDWVERCDAWLPPTHEQSCNRAIAIAWGHQIALHLTLSLLPSSIILLLPSSVRHRAKGCAFPRLSVLPPFKDVFPQTSSCIVAASLEICPFAIVSWRILPKDLMSKRSDLFSEVAGSSFKKNCRPSLSDFKLYFRVSEL